MPSLSPESDPTPLTGSSVEPPTSERLLGIGLIVAASLAAALVDRIAPRGSWRSYTVVAALYGKAIALAIGVSSRRHPRVVALERRIGRWRTALFLGALGGVFVAACRIVAMHAFG
jgi:hypothetical protein